MTDESNENNEDSILFLSKGTSSVDNNEKKRANWSSDLDFFFSAISFAGIGLGQYF